MHCRLEIDEKKLGHQTDAIQREMSGDRYLQSVIAQQSPIAGMQAMAYCQSNGLKMNPRFSKYSFRLFGGMRI